MSVRENDFSITILISSFIHDQYGYKIDQEHDGVLILVNLSTFDLDELVGHVFSNMEHDLVLQHMLDHLIILRL